MTVSVFVGVSVDGFLARPDGALDFLDHAGNVDHGYDAFMASVDALVVGRKTFETAMGFPNWPYGTKRVVVLSHGRIDLAPAQARGGQVEAMSGSPREIVSRLAATGSSHLYVDGGQTIQGFLRDGCVDRMVVSRVPVLIGDGIPLFGSLPHDVLLRHVATRTYPSGLVQSEYTVAR
jgi:dihydrofolate reductase